MPQFHQEMKRSSMFKENRSAQRGTLHPLPSNNKSNNDDEVKNDEKNDSELNVKVVQLLKLSEIQYRMVLEQLCKIKYILLL